ncbi:MAG: low specificity L-threonine aldolase [Candidatus Cloacimonetes bacterium]|nr:low specificity L-threonine aldolase [Candidatus Cloacimonadota bacterium]
MTNYTFGSDNHSPVHPRILQYMEKINTGAMKAYGYDPVTAEAEKLFKTIFGAETEVYFVFNGTGANILSIRSFLQPFQAVICADTAHINCDECGAPEFINGVKLLYLPNTNGKLTIDQIASKLHGRGDEHHNDPAIVSITQSTELGTLYTLKELKEITEFCHSKKLKVHMDGARISNAAVALGCTFKEMTTDVGIDVLSFGGTKNGLLMAEAVVFLNSGAPVWIKHLRKQNMQLMSKMRYIAGQFLPYLQEELWKENAQKANSMAQYLRKELIEAGVEITRNTDVNAVFCRIPKQIKAKILPLYFFYTWDEDADEVRLMCSFTTQEQEIDDFVTLIRETTT